MTDFASMPAGKRRFSAPDVGLGYKAQARSVDSSKPMPRMVTVLQTVSLPKVLVTARQTV